MLISDLSLYLHVIGIPAQIKVSLINCLQHNKCTNSPHTVCTSCKE